PRQEKQVFGQHCFKFLSTYIWVSSGYGPLKTSIKRPITLSLNLVQTDSINDKRIWLNDEALRPGVYALIDSCSPHDLQYLNTAFGEGPCGNALATLQQNYKLTSSTEGKSR
ncbi:unnamed protein product, partial [Thlaspi arvense]